MAITLRSLLLALACLASSSAWGAPGERVQQLMEGTAPPPGVVFEVISGNESQLAAVLPAIRAHARRLRGSYPGLPIAVLTHDSEQFSLLTDNAGPYGTIHDAVAVLGDEDGIPVQVCGNHAAWRDKSRDDFPD